LISKFLEKRVGRMKAWWSVGFVMVLLASCAIGAAALDTPSSTVRHAKTKAPRQAAQKSSSKTKTASKSHTAAKKTSATTKTINTSVAAATARAGRQVTVKKAAVVRRRRYSERFTASSFANGTIGDGDITAGEDPVVRQAAIDALNGMNGTAVVIDPSNGRILAMVNQKLALSPGAEPCSTIKLSVALAALSEGLVTRDTPVQLAGFRMNMTQALAKSNNLYFEELGRELGFDRVRHYANQFGLGELAGYNIEGEQLGTYPDHAIPEVQGGVGRMCSFGQGVSMTPLQLGAMVAAIANGGTLYYLQHPTSPEEVGAFQPKVKRALNIAQYIPDIEDGMAGAVEYGTARSLRTNFSQLPVFGKTGTCSDSGTRFGWFVSFSNSPQGSLVTVFFLEGGRPTFGPRAAELTGEFYRNLWSRDYFQSKGQEAEGMPVPSLTRTGGGTGIVQ
jgi:membrane carboxypeptidase/penicillin-binding protein